MTPPSHPTLVSRLRELAAHKCGLTTVSTDLLREAAQALEDAQVFRTINHAEALLKLKAAEARVVSLEARVEKLRRALKCIYSFTTDNYARDALIEDDAAKETA
jgi:hypothetical protein